MRAGTHRRVNAASTARFPAGIVTSGSRGSARRGRSHRRRTRRSVPVDHRLQHLMRFLLGELILELGKETPLGRAVAGTLVQHFADMRGQRNLAAQLVGEDLLARLQVGLGEGAPLGASPRCRRPPPGRSPRAAAPRSGRRAPRPRCARSRPDAAGRRGRNRATRRWRRGGRPAAGSKPPASGSRRRWARRRARRGGRPRDPAPS